MAHAEDRERARAAFARATQRYDTGDYKDAIEDLKDAVPKHADPALIFNVAQCHRQLGDLAQAIRRYRMYLAKLRMRLMATTSARSSVSST